MQDIKQKGESAMISPVFAGSFCFFSTLFPKNVKMRILQFNNNPFAKHGCGLNYSRIG